MSRIPADRAPASGGTRKKRTASVMKFDSDVSVLEKAPMAGTWLDRIRLTFTVESMARGLEAAQLGKVRKLQIEQGCITAQVKSEMGDTRRVSLHLPLISEVAWERIVEAMSSEAIYAACLLDRQWPPDLSSIRNTAGSLVCRSSRYDMGHPRPSRELASRRGRLDVRPETGSGSTSHARDPWTVDRCAFRPAATAANADESRRRHDASQSADRIVASDRRSIDGMRRSVLEDGGWFRRGQKACDTGSRPSCPSEETRRNDHG